MAIFLSLMAMASAAEPGDALQVRQETPLADDDTTIANLPEGVVVTVERVDQGRLWCLTPLGVGWVAADDLMTCGEGIKIWKQKIADGDAAAYFNLGLADDTLGDLKQAISDFEEFLKVMPDDPAAITNRGFCRLKLGDADQALKDFSASIEIMPSGMAYSNRANAYLMLGDGKAALADCVRALLLQPENTYALVNRGSAQRLLGNYAAAVADYQRALALDGSSCPACRNFALLRGAAADEKFRNGQEAVELAQKACKATNDRDALSLSALAVACAETGDWEAALRWQSEAIKQEKLVKNQPEHQRRLELFKAHQPFRLKVGTPVPDD
jgi:tetratricopeptide (TPR) repeat protein